MNSRLRQKVIDLRVNQELSYSEIRKRYNIPKSTLSYWLREFPLQENKILELQRRGWKKGESGREKFRTTMRKRREFEELKIYARYKEKFTSITENMFFVAGLMLYAAEGDKRNESRLVITNTDYKIVKFFIHWVKKFLEIRENEIKIQLHLYENMDVMKEQEFWQNNLMVTQIQFYKPMVRKLKDNSFLYQGSFRHGTCSLYILGGDRKREVMNAINAFMEQVGYQF